MMELNSGLTIIDGDRTNLGIKTENVGTITSWESKGRPPLTSRVVNKLKEVTQLHTPTIVDAIRKVPGIENAVVVGADIEHLTVGNGMVIVPVPDGVVAMVAIIRDAKFANQIKVALYNEVEGFTRVAFEDFVNSLKELNPINVNLGMFGKPPSDEKELGESYPRGLEFYRESIYKIIPSISTTRSMNIVDQLGRTNKRRNEGYCVIAFTNDFEGLDFVTIYNPYD